MYRMINGDCLPSVRIRKRRIVPRAAADELSGAKPVHHPPLGPGLLDVNVAARVLRVAPETLYRLIRDGGFPAVHLRGRVLVPGSSVDAMAAAAMRRRRLVDPREWVTSSCTSHD